MKEKLLRIVSMLVVVVMLSSVIPLGDGTVEAANIDENTFQSKIQTFKENVYGNGSTYRDNDSSTLGYQCFGYANYISRYIFGSYPASDMSGVNRKNGWTIKYGASAIDNLHVGDVVRYRFHSIFITSISGNTVYYTDANSDNNNTVYWGSHKTKDELKNLVAQNLTSGVSGINGKQYTGWVAHFDDWNHIHSYTGFYFEEAHPHRVYQQCSCGKTKYTGAEKAYGSCSTCMKKDTTYPVPIKAYTLATGKTVVYNSVGGNQKSNKIYDTDLCTITAVYDCGWCKVTFPLDAGGTETGYVKTAAFFKPTYEVFKVKAGKQLSIYARSDLSKSIGYAGSGGSIYVIGHGSKAVQVLCPQSGGGYKAGWLPISAFTYTIKYNANGGSGTMANSTVKFGGDLTLSVNEFAKEGDTFCGWNVYRSSDKTWYCKGIGWKTASEISKNNYAKSVYKDQLECTFTKTWINGGKTNDIYTFYPVWEANVLSVYYNANGGSLRSDKFKLSDNLIYYASDNSKFVQTWTYNDKKTNGLVNYSSFDLGKTGHTFKGWGTTASGNRILDQNDTDLVPTDINSNIKNGSCKKTMYAIWEPNTYTVKFNANGGVGAPSNQTKIYGKTLVLSATIPTREGYTFKGWATTSTATVSAYAVGANYTSNKAITLYAVWQLDDIGIAHTHEWNTDYTVDKEATCTEAGSKSIRCKTCGKISDVKEIPIIDHSFEPVIKRESSCSLAGEVVNRCTICEKETEQREIPMLAHSFISTIVTEATCTEEGKKEDVCLECQLHTNTVVIPMAEHEFDEWTVSREATVNEDGLESRTCINCEFEETRTIDYVPIYDEDAPRVTLQNVKADAGDSVTVSVNLANNPGITALRFVVEYDTSALTMTEFVFGEALSSMNKGTSEKYESPYSFSMYSATSDLKDDGVVATITFKVKEDAADGEYPIYISYEADDVFNLAGEQVHFETESGAIVVRSYTLGDLNEDSKVNMRDVVLLQQAINGWNVTYNTLAADFNGDTKINMRDIVALQQHING